MELIERYVREVGRRLPPGKRADIEAELRSLLLDQLEDRIEGQPSESDVVALLKDIGHPREVAASYGGKQTLIGPALYPTFLVVLRVGLIVFVILNLIGFGIALSTVELANVGSVLLDALAGLVQSLLGFVGAVVIIFAALEYFGVKVEEADKDWNPRDLSAVDDHTRVNQVETAIGITFSLVYLAILMFFRQAGGITFYFGFDEAAGVIPVPEGSLWLLMGVVVFQVLLDIYILQRGRWEVGSRLVHLGLDIAGVLLFYSALLLPVANWLSGRVPENIEPILRSGPRAFLFLVLAIVVIDNVVKLARMLFSTGSARSTLSPNGA